jgi:tight adherence protein B
VIAIVTILFFLVTFLIAALAVLLAWLALQRGQSPLESSQTILSPQTILKEESLSTIEVWASLLKRFDFSELVQRHLDQADLAWSVGRFTLLMLLCGSIGFTLALHWKAPDWLAALIGVFAAALPYFYLRRRRAKRFRRFEEAFPDALDSLARALRAGHPFAAGIEILANESLPPVSTEMRTAAMEANLGTSWEIALENLARRIPLLEVRMFVSALQLQARTGGKLNEVLSNVAETMREATALKGEVRTLAAHGRLTGLVLTFLPVAIAIIMWIVSPSYLAILVHHPNGKFLIAGALICLVLGHLVIRRIVDIQL